MLPERLATALARYGFGEQQWSDERPMRFTVKRKRGELLDEISFEGQEASFVSGFVIGSTFVLSVAQQLNLDDCQDVPSGVPWPPIRDTWVLITAGMSALLYECLQQRPPIVFKTDLASIEDTVESWLACFDKLQPFLYAHFVDDLAIARFLTGQRVPQELRMAVAARPTLFTAARGHAVNIDAALIFALRDEHLACRETLDVLSRVSDAARARGELSASGHRVLICQSEKISRALQAR